MTDLSQTSRGLTADVGVRSDSVWSPGRRRLTAGLVLTVTLVAFESLAVSTVMPVVKDELGGLGLYGWVFSGFYLGCLLGIVVAGQMADRRGTRLPFVIGLITFSTGLVIGAAAQSMGMLVAGRVVQGFGVGTIPAVAYVSVGRVYPPDLRPRVFAVFSTAWVVPSLVGPAAGSALTEAWSWRAVFGALLPLVAIAAAMTVPVLTDGLARPTSGHPDGELPGDGEAPAVAPARTDGELLAERPAPNPDGLASGTGPAVARAVTDGPRSATSPPSKPDGGLLAEGKVLAEGPAPNPDGEAPIVAPVGTDGELPGDGEAPVESPGEGRARGSRSKTGAAALLVAGAAAVLAGTSASSPFLAVALVVVGLPPAVWAFLQLVPRGTITLAPGLPAAVAARGILTFAFFGADVFVPLELKDARDRSTFMAGAALTAATVAWTAAAWIQQRVIAVRGPRWLVRRGFLCVTVGIAGMLLVLSPDVPAWLALPLWGVAGFGMGLSFAPLTVTTLDTAQPGLEGEATSALQLTDVLGSSISIGLGGAFVRLGETRGWDVGTSLVPVYVLTAAVALAGILAAARLPHRLRQQSV